MADSDLCLAAEVKMFLELNEKEVDIENDMIDKLITNRTSEIHNYCNVEQFKSKEYVEYINGSGTQLLYPRYTPIISVSSIYNTTTYDYDSTSLIDSDDYFIANDFHIILPDSYFYHGKSNIKITYNAGYSVIPGDLNQACINEVIMLFKQLSDTALHMTSAGERGGYRDIELLPSTISVLEKKYMRAGA